MDNNPNQHIIELDRTGVTPIMVQYEELEEPICLLISAIETEYAVVDDEDVRQALLLHWGRARDIISKLRSETYLQRAQRVMDQRAQLNFELKGPLQGRIPRTEKALQIFNEAILGL